MARLLDSVIGHEKNIQAFLQALRLQRLPNTFLFVGPSGIGKRLVAAALAQALLCETSMEACGHCPSCLRVAKKHHESLRQIEPDKTQIKIEQTREILDFLSLQSLTERRVIIVDQAEKLNPQAGNSLLKILEEPSSGTYFFLIAPSPSHVLPTLRSRSQIMSFRPLTLAQLKQKSHAPEWVLRASQGSLERVKTFSDPEELETRTLAVDLIKSWLHEPQGFLRNDFREAFRNRAHALSLSKYIGLLLKDAVSWQLGDQQALLNPDQSALFQSLETHSLAHLMETAQKALRLESAFLQNRDSQLVFEEFWIQTQVL
jgi:DNA polymerase-3 subunit delta'